jgi:hypothetical protein
MRAAAGVSSWSLPRGEGGGPLGPERLGRYQLLRKIAVGGMAEIYLARVSGAGGFEKNVVVKRILPQLAESDEVFTMFLDEARIAATLQHPNLVDIYDAGQEDREYFIAMEHLDGADLHTVARVLRERRTSMPLQHAVFIATSVAAGLHYAHEKLGLDGRPLRIVHRDVTPQNVFLTRDGGVKLVDFGIAKATNRVSTTTHGTLKGKLAYMAPEQCRAEPVDRRSDIYSLGVLLYELTCGRRPHRGRSEYELLHEIVEGTVPPPSLAVSGYPAELEAIVMRALAPDAAARYQSALAMERDLERFARRNGLVGSTLALAEFLAPVLAATAARAEARTRQCASSAPPSRTDADAQVTVAEFLGRRPGRAPSRPLAVEADEPDPAAMAEEAGDGALTGTLPDSRRDERARPRRAVPLGLSLLLAAGGTAAALYYDGADPGLDGSAAAAPKVAPAPAPPRPPPPSLGRLEVTTDPPGAAVWLSLGPAPAVSGAVDAGSGQWIRVEHDGYATRDLLMDAGQAIAVELEPSAGAASPREPTAMPGATGVPAPEDARIRVSSQPPAANVWLLVGVTPARIELAAGRELELRLGRDGYFPAFVVIPPGRFGASGEASLSAPLTPRPEARVR